jgi:hypothetical protein
MIIFAIFRILLDSVGSIVSDVNIIKRELIIEDSSKNMDIFNINGLFKFHPIALKYFVILPKYYKYDILTQSIIHWRK